jgi:hypothetical protein
VRLVLSASGTFAVSPSGLGTDIASVQSAGSAVPAKTLEYSHVNPVFIPI